MRSIYLFECLTTPQILSLTFLSFFPPHHFYLYKIQFGATRRNVALSNLYSNLELPCKELRSVWEVLPQNLWTLKIAVGSVNLQQCFMEPWHIIWEPWNWTDGFSEIVNRIAEVSWNPMQSQFKGASGHPLISSDYALTLGLLDKWCFGLTASESQLAHTYLICWFWTFKRNKNTLHRESQTWLSVIQMAFMLAETQLCTQRNIVCCASFFLWN